MKIFLLLLLVSVSSLLAEEKPYSVGWLRKGCLALSKFENNDKNITPSESKAGMDLGVWIQGCMQAIQMMHFSNEDSIKNPPDKWMSSLGACSSIQSYLREFEEKKKVRVPDEMDAMVFVKTWYDVKHPKSKPAEAFGYEELFFKIYFEQEPTTKKSTE